MCLRNVLGVLEDAPERLWSTFAAAVELSQAERARLTLVKTRASAHPNLWCVPFGPVPVFVAPDDVDPETRCGRLLARAAEFVPMEIPVTTLVLGSDAGRDLRRLVETGAYDAVVASRPFLARARRLRRECCRDGVRAVAVQPRPGAGPTADPSGRLDGVESLELRR